MFIDINAAKKHLNIDDDYKEDDSYIIALIGAAEDAIAKFCNIKNLSKLVDPDTGYIPESVRHAVLLLVGSWYANREAVSNLAVNKVPYGLEFLSALNTNYRTTF